MAFEIFSVSLNSTILITIRLGVGLFGFILLGTLCTSWTGVGHNLWVSEKGGLIVSDYSSPSSASDEVSCWDSPGEWTSLEGPRQLYSRY